MAEVDCGLSNGNGRLPASCYSRQSIHFTQPEGTASNSLLVSGAVATRRSNRISPRLAGFSSLPAYALQMGGCQDRFCCQLPERVREKRRKSLFAVGPWAGIIRARVGIVQ